MSALLAFLHGESQAQFYNGSQLTFGKNRVQHQNFNWQYLRAEQYDVYFYPTSKSLAQYVYYKVPECLKEVEKILNYTSNKKLIFVVYNTQEDFRESNFAFDDENFYNQGGVTNIYGNKIYLYFDGNRLHFDRMIRGGVMEVYAHWVAQGSSMGSNISSDYLMNVPDWFYSGLSSYYGESWNSEVDAHVKDGVLTQRFIDFDELSVRDAMYAGHSFWKYIVDTYGDDMIARVLYATRSTKTVERGFYFATGVPFKYLKANWYKYYYVMFHQDAKRTMPEGDGVVNHPRKKRDYSQICLSEDENNYAYVTNEAGQIRVWLKTADRSRPKCIWKRYQKVEDNPDYSYPLLAWHPYGGVLGLTMESKGHCYYLPYDLEKRKWEKKSLVDVEKITSWCYSNDGQLMLFSGFRNGQSDIFLYSFLSHSYQNLTNDFYDDFGPIFLQKQQQIVFSSNRPRDSILLKDDFMEAEPQQHYDLFLYQYAKKDPALLRVTHTPMAEEYGAQPVGAQEIIFLSDKDGLVNRYAAKFDSTISRIDTAIHYAYYAKTRALTDRGSSILEHSYNPSSNTVADISLNEKVKRIYFTPLDLSVNKDVSPSVFHNKINQQKAKADSVKQALDSIKDVQEPLQHGFAFVYANEDSNHSSEDISANESSKTAEKEFQIPVGLPYRVQYTINRLVTQADFSFLNTSYQQFEGGTSPIYLNTGFNALFMLGIHDVFENYRITGGFRLSATMDGREFMFSYENLLHRLDRQLVLYRQSITGSDNANTYTQTSNSLFYILKFPFDKTSSLRLSLNGRYETRVVRSLSDASLKFPDTHRFWAGAKLEYVFDSSKELYTNLWRGTKLKLFAEYEQRIEKETQNLVVLGVDVRKSFKLYKNMTFAVRAAASTNTGSARLVYYMGGVDNWINAKFNSDIWVDQSKNYAYQTLATNMRGFRQNIRNGTSFALVSAELRVPFVQLIAGRHVPFEVLNSLQLNLFGDVGTAWTGLSPYSEDNCLYTRYITSGPVTAMVRRQVEPIVGGFGIGLRCSLLTYFLRFDYAWGVEDFKVANPKGMFLFSIGTDF